MDLLENILVEEKNLGVTNLKLEKYIMRVGSKLPNVDFKFRLENESGQFEWKNIDTEELFNNKRVIAFSLPGAFTPTCSNLQLPSFDLLFNKFRDKFGVDAIYCISVNDAFVMNAWGKSLNIKNVNLIPDGNGDFTRSMNMLVQKKNLGFGMRSWRYAFIARNGVIDAWFEEPGIEDNANSDPYGATSPDSILEYLEDILLK